MPSFPAEPFETRLHVSNRVLGWWVLVLAVLSFTLAAFLPVYTDEVTWSAILGRLNYDNGLSLSVPLQPTCMGSYAAAAEPELRVVRQIDTALYDVFSTPLRLRLWGVTLALLWLLITWRLLLPLLPGSMHAAAGRLLLAWSTLGVMPFLLVLSRPEKMLLLGTTVLLLVALRSQRLEARLGADLAYAAATLAGCWYLLGEHPRGLFLLPLMCTFAYRRIARVPLRYVLMSGLVLLALLMAHAWQPFSSCNGDPRFSAELELSNFGAAHFLHHDRLFVRALLVSLMRPSGWSLVGSSFLKEYTGRIVPGASRSMQVLLGWPMVLLSLLLLAAAALGTFLASGTVRRHRTEVSLVLTLLTAWLVYLANDFVRVSKAAYESTYMEPLVGLLIFASFWVYLKLRQPDVRPPMWSKLLTVTQFVLLLLSVASQVALLVYYTPRALQGWLAAGGPPEQGMSLSIGHFDQNESNVLSTAKMCGISPTAKLHHLAVDEGTYFTFRSSNEPLFLLYLGGKYWSRYQPDPTNELRALRSSGVVAHCYHLPDVYQALAKRGNNDYCCLPSFVGQ